MVIKMTELKEHEVLAQNKDGKKVVVSAAYFKQNEGKLKMVDDNGWKNKMDTLGMANKSDNPEEPEEPEEEDPSEDK